MLPNQLYIITTTPIIYWLFGEHLNLYIHTTGMHFPFIHHIHTWYMVGTEMVYSRFGHVAHKAVNVPTVNATFMADDMYDQD